mmetsp:Transcript_3083/g.10088  ORF Transcript_3083/g.10088 Transcript_3083/m.10088 type:complete len:328 (+) Transcript_3083:2535-3518(+)
MVVVVSASPGNVDSWSNRTFFSRGAARDASPASFTMVISTTFSRRSCATGDRRPRTRDMRFKFRISFSAHSSDILRADRLWRALRSNRKSESSRSRAAPLFEKPAPNTLITDPDAGTASTTDSLPCPMTPEGVAQWPALIMLAMTRSDRRDSGCIQAAGESDTACFARRLAADDDFGEEPARPPPPLTKPLPKPALAAERPMDRSSARRKALYVLFVMEISSRPAMSPAMVDVSCKRDILRRDERRLSCLVIAPASRSISASSRASWSLSTAACASSSSVDGSRTAEEEAAAAAAEEEEDDDEVEEGVGDPDTASVNSFVVTRRTRP